jgi:sulfofructosephosphate aldolase
MESGTSALGLGPIARRGGGLAMVAIDQRESLRTMIESVTDAPVDDRAVEGFKVEVAKSLSPVASAMLFDRQFAVPAFEAASVASPTCGRIVAVDTLIQVPGSIVTDTELDESADVAAIAASGAVALKFLVLWRGQENADRCVEMARAFVAMCRRGGLIAILEAMVRLPSDADEATWDRNAAIVDAARTLGAVAPDLYKSDVPSYGRGSAEEICEWSQKVTSALPCPWVVLSNGVSIEDFASAVTASCRGGASGFLAGRAIWADCLGADHSAKLQDISVPRLQHLVQIVDDHARPWTASA